MYHTSKIKANIFDIQRFSLNDGPGIRTSIFFKGCPLRCLWCHNPESYMEKKQLVFHQRFCIGCMECVKVCKYGVHTIELVGDKQMHAVAHEKCAGCGKCIEVCCYDALELLGKTYTPEELFEKIRIDIPYYSINGEAHEAGGITLTGGEPMQQYEFINEFCKLTENIHICMETSGYVKTEYFERIRSNINLFLFDYKVTDSKKHKQLCGVGNEIILKNLDYLYNKGSNIILRLPLIPGINDDDEHLQGITDILKKYPRISQGEIMPYHNIGISKAEDLGTNAGIELSNTKTDQINIWLDRLKAKGAKNIKIG